MVYNRMEMIGAITYCRGMKMRSSDWMEAPRTSQVWIDSWSRRATCSIVGVMYGYQ